MELVREICSLPGKFEVGLFNLSVSDFTKFGEIFLNYPFKEKIKYIGVMLQHYNDGVLKRMGRKLFDKERFMYFWNHLGKEGICLYTHIIIGFPGETEDEFQDLLKFIDGTEHNSFTVLSFCYSRRPGTLAPVRFFNDEIPEKIQKERHARFLRAFSKHKRINFFDKFRWKVVYYCHAKKVRYLEKIFAANS